MVPNDVVGRNLHQVINDIQLIVLNLENLKRTGLTEVELHREVDRLLEVALDTGRLVHESRKMLPLLKIDVTF